MTIFPLGRHYLIQSASFRPDDNLFTRNIFTWTTISLGWSYFHSDDYIFTWIIISSSGQQTFTWLVNFHSTVNFHSDGKLFTPGLIRPRIETNYIWKSIGSTRRNFSVLKVFWFKAVLMAELLAQPIRQVSGTSRHISVEVRSECITSKFCIWTRIEMIYISKSIASTRRRQFL